MASVSNAFDLLVGGAEQPAVVAATASSKAKKKSKKKGGSGGLAEPQAEPQIIKAAERAPEPRVQTTKDAGEALEAATVAASSGELGALALEWAEQMVRGDGLYTDGNKLVDFKQVLLKSRGLEALTEAVCARGTVGGESRPLSQLLGAAADPSVSSGLPLALAAAAASLGQLAAADPLAPTAAAKRAVVAAVGLLKRGVPKPPPSKPVEAPASTLRRLGGELGRAEARLGASTQPKELCKLYGAILELLTGQVDVLRPGGGAQAPHQAPELTAALRALEELRAALAARLQEVQEPPKPKMSVEDQVKEAEAAHRKEEAASAARLSEVESRIASLEAELAGLRSEASDLKERRSQAAGHLKSRVQAIRTGKPAKGASPAEIAAALQSGLGAVEGLAGAVCAGGTASGNAAAPAADAAGLASEVVASEVPVKLLGAMQQVVELNMQQLAELGGKARFYRERLAKAVKQGEQAAKLGVGDPKMALQQRATAEKNVKDVYVAAEGAAAACRAAVASYRERLPVMLCLPTFLPPPPDYLAALDARVAEADAIVEGIKAGTYVPPAPAAAPIAQQAAAPAPRVFAERLPAAGGVPSLEARLAMLEAETLKKDAQIAAMVNSATLDVPSPLAGGRTSMPPAMLSSPTNNKPIGPAAPIAPAMAAPGPAPAPAPAPLAAPAAPISFSQALAAGGPANGRRPVAPRRA